MTMTNRFDAGNPNHTIPCGRMTCTAPDVTVHMAGAHLDQRSPFYDGPSTQLAATSMYVRDSAWKIIRTAPELTPEVVDLITYIDGLQDQVAHVQVDKDRSVRQASARALDCEAHGEVIKGLEEQVTHFDQTARRSEAGRIAVLGLLFELDSVVEKLTTGQYREGLTAAELAGPLREAVAKTRRAHDRAWRS